MAHEGYYSGSSNLGNVNELLNEAELYRDQASDSAVDAAASAVDAAASAAEAVTTATAASSSASAAAASAIDSSNYAINSLSSSTNAASSAAAAATSATNAYDSAAAAATSATNSANSASAAAASAASIDPASLLTKAGNLAGLADKAVSRENLGIFNFAKNKIINGKMDVSQRGTSFPAAAAGAYTLDRWSFTGFGGGVVTVAQQAEGPPTNEFNFSQRITVTTADASIAAGDVYTVTQAIEGYNVRDLIGKTFTISFSVRSPKTGVHCLSLRNSAADRGYVAEYTVSAANTWEYKTITVVGGLITAGTWNWTSGTGLSISFTLAAGSNFAVAPNTWVTGGNPLATPNQVNCLDTIGNIFAITGVQLEAGSVATPFEHRLYGQELALCQRYYEVLAGRIVGPRDAGGGFVTWQYKAEKRAVPTIVLGSGGTTGAGNATTSNCEFQTVSVYPIVNPGTSASAEL